MSKPSQQQIITTSKLKGHQGAVLTLDHSSSVSNPNATQQQQQQQRRYDTACLLSGSEDATARLWDLRERHLVRASLCIKTIGPVMSVCFGPYPEMISYQSQDAVVVESCDAAPSLWAREFGVYLATGQSVFGFDLRKANAPIVQHHTPSNPSSSLSVDLSSRINAQDEINQLCISCCYNHISPQDQQLANRNKSSGGGNHSRKHKKTNYRRRRGPSNATSTTGFDSSSNRPWIQLAAGDDAGSIRVIDRDRNFDQEPVKQMDESVDMECGEEEGNEETGPAPMEGYAPAPRIYCHGPTEPEECAIVLSVAFQPNHDWPYQHLLASGGTDCTVRLWDVAATAILQQPSSSPAVVREPLSAQVMNSSDVNANQVCNPPMVNHLAWSPSGRLLTAALGDGSIAILTTTTTNSSSKHARRSAAITATDTIHSTTTLETALVQAARLEEAHSGPVAQVLFPEWQPWSAPSTVSRNPRTKKQPNKSSGNSSLVAQDRLLCSAGNDGALLLWDLGTTLCNDAVDVTFGRPNDDDNDGSILSALFRSLRLIDSDHPKDNDGLPQTLFGWKHGSEAGITCKPNWMVSSRGCDPVFPFGIFVADTSNEITAYSMPIQY